MVRRLAARLLYEVHSAAVFPGPASERPLEDYVEILRWAERPRAAIVTVRRPGFVPGAFTIRLDTRDAPLTARHFATLAEEGFYDGREILRVVPPRLVQLGSLDGAERSFRDEIAPGRFPPAAVGMTNRGPDTAAGPWFVTTTPQPQLAGRTTAFGRVVQNFPGVAALLLPGDRIVSVEVYEGNGTEPVPHDF
jgi:cyclophilin family peptidyl-prolyl cis-trans isomerase